MNISKGNFMKRICLLYILFLFITETTDAQTWHFGFEDWNAALTYGATGEEYSVPDNNLCYPYLSGNAEGVSTGGEIKHNEVIPGWSAIIYGLLRTTDAYSGNYAGIVHMWYNGSMGILAYGSSEYVTTFGGLPKVHFENKLYGISGFYKYMVDSFIPSDTYKKVAMLNIATYRKNTAGNLELLSLDSLQFEESDVYNEFYLSVADTNLIPDSVSIWFETKGYGSGTTSCILAHFLYLDDLQFHFEPLSTKNNNSFREKLKIYPNPASEKINIDYGSSVRIQNIQLTDVSGRVIKTFRKNEKVLNVSGLPGGVYFLHIRAEDGNVNEKILIR